MADVTINDLPAIASVGAATQFETDTGGATSNKATGAQIKTFCSASPTLVTPTLGVATATSVNKVAITAPASSATLTIADGKTLTANNSLTFAGTDSTTMTFPSTSATIARTDAANTFTGASTASAWVLTSPTITTKISPTTDDGAPLGDTTHNFSDLFLASGAVINYANGNVVLTQTSGILSMGTGEFRITTPGTNSASAVTVGGTQTLTAKTLTDAVNTVSTPGTTSVGYLGAPQNSQSADYTLALTDSGKHIYHPDADTSGRTWTIPANNSIAFPIGTVIGIQNGNGAGAITLAITSDTLRWGSSTGSRTIAANGTATLLKVTSTVWRLTGDGIT